MTRGDLPGVQVWGRPIKPVAAGMSILMAVLVVVNLNDSGLFQDSVLGDGVALLAFASFGMLMWGWWGRSQRAAEVGLLLAAIVYVVRASFLMFTLGPAAEAVWLSVGGAVIAGGAFLLERWDYCGTKDEER